jgi:penicillin-binding protein 1A
MLEGAIKRGTGRKLKALNLSLAGKTGTTNKNMDAWFIGFTSKIVIGVYVGFDEPKTLGKYETGAKVALPIFKKFVEQVVVKKDARPFKIPSNIHLVVVDTETGLKSDFNSKTTIYESFKSENVKNVNIEKFFTTSKLENHDINANRKTLTFY